MKTAIRLACAGLALLVLAGVGLYLYLTPERLRALIVPRLSKSLDRTVEIDTVSLSLWGGINAVVDGLTIQERPGFGPTPFVSARGMDISIPILPLLTGEGKLGTITIRSPSLSLLVNENGESNFSDLFEPDSSASSGRVLPINHIVLSDAALRYRDQSQNTDLSIEGLDLDVAAGLEPGAISLQGTVSLDELSSRSGGDSEPFRTGALASEFRVGYSADLVQIRELELRKGGVSLAITGTTDLSGETTALDLRIQSTDAPLAELVDWLHPGTSVGGRISLDLEMKTVPGDSTSWLRSLLGAVTLEDVAAAVPGLSHPVSRGSARLVLQPDRMRLEQLTAFVSGSKLDIQGHVDRWWAFDAPVYPVGSFRITADSLNIDQLLSAPQTAWWNVLVPGASVFAQQEPPPDLGWTETVDLNLSLNTPRVRYTDHLIENVGVSARIAKGIITIENAALRSRGGKIGASGTLDLRNPNYYASRIEGKIEDLDLAAVPGLLEPGASLAGRADITFTSEARLDPMLSIPFSSQLGRLDNPRISGKATLRDIRFTSPDLGAPAEISTVDLAVEADRISTRKLAVKAGRSQFLISGAVEGYLAFLLHDPTVRPAMQVMIGSPYCNLDELLPVADTPGPPASASTWSLVTRAYAAAPAVDETSLIIPVCHYADGTAILDFTTLVTDSITISDLQAHANTRNGKLDVRPITATAYDGRVTGYFTMDASRESGPYPVTSQLDIVDVEANTLLTHALGEATPMFGKINVKVGLKGAVDSVMTLVRKELSAQGGLGMQHGRIQNWGWLKDALSDVQELGFLSFDEIPIKRLQAPFRIQNERFHFDEITLVASDMTCKITGSTGFDGSINAILDAWIPARHLNVAGINVGNALSSLFGKTDRRIPVRVTFGGSSDKPKVAVDVQPEGWEQFDRKVEEKEEKLYKDAEKLLKKWWNQN